MESTIVEFLLIISIVVFVVLLFMYKSISEDNESKPLYAEKNNINIKECTSSICETLNKVQQGIDRTMNLVNRPNDYNDKQVLTKYNKNTYRNEKGRYASLNKV
jgi:pantothenate kinase type III